MMGIVSRGLHCMPIDVCLETATPAWQTIWGVLSSEDLWFRSAFWQLWLVGGR